MRHAVGAAPALCRHRSAKCGSFRDIGAITASWRRAAEVLREIGGGQTLVNWQRFRLTSSSRMRRHSAIAKPRAIARHVRRLPPPAAPAQLPRTAIDDSTASLPSAPCLATRSPARLRARSLAAARCSAARARRARPAPAPGRPGGRARSTAPRSARATSRSPRRNRPAACRSRCRRTPKRDYLIAYLTDMILVAKAAEAKKLGDDAGFQAPPRLSSATSC